MAAQLQATAVFVTKENGEMCRVSFFEVDALPGGGDGGDGGDGGAPILLCVHCRSSLRQCRYLAVLLRRRRRRPAAVPGQCTAKGYC